MPLGTQRSVKLPSPWDYQGLGLCTGQNRICLPQVPFEGIMQLLDRVNRKGGRTVLMATGQQSQRMESRRVFCEPFVLIGAMNPCPCGWYGDPVKECTCSNAMVRHHEMACRYPPRLVGRAASSGPLLDRADLRWRRSAIGPIFDRTTSTWTCRGVEAGLGSQMENSPTSARACDELAGVRCILKLARTIADLAGSDGIETAHLAEAIQYRPRRQARQVRRPLGQPPGPTR